MCLEEEEVGAARLPQRVSGLAAAPLAGKLQKSSPEAQPRDKSLKKPSEARLLPGVHGSGCNLQGSGGARQRELPPLPQRSVPSRGLSSNTGYLPLPVPHCRAQLTGSCFSFLDAFC